MTQLFRIFTTLILVSVLLISPLQGDIAFAVQSESEIPPGKSFTVPPGQAKKLEYEGAILELEAGAVVKNKTVTIIPLAQENLPALDQGMSTITGGQHYGYRMLPHNTKFKKKITIKLPYDPALIPVGMTEDDLKTFFFDDQAGTWQELERVKVDTKQKLVVSLTDHFTDFINATLTVPDHPETLSYDPNTIQGIKAADPGAAINLIEPPQGNAMGGANLSYPIEIPPGRGGMQPQLSVNYNSDGGNGWMGLGWDVAVPSISIDTRWGVPRYDPVKETETYLLNGGQLTPLAHRTDLVDRTSESKKVFYERIEGSFSYIVRLGKDPTNYWWEVTDKNGVRYIYGDPPGTLPAETATLTDANGNIFKWSLREIQDLNGNAVYYSYERVSDFGMAEGTVPGWQLYPKSINYTQDNGTAGPYTIEFMRDPVRRPDVVIDARGGFKMVTAERLARITVLYNDEQIRAYEFDYEQGAFNKTLLHAIRQLGENNELFNEHTFSYFDEVQPGEGFDSPEPWSLGEDSVDWLTGTVLKEELLGNLTSFSNEGNATGLSGAVSDSYGTHLYTGLSPTPTKWVSAGVKVGFNYSQTETVLALIDINGDSLLDKLFLGGWELYYRLNRSGPDATPQFAEARKVVGIREIGKENATTWSGGAEAYASAGIFDNAASTTTTSSIYFTDANGDGLPDLAKDGVIYFNHLQNGVPTFSRNSGDTQVPVVPVPGVSADHVDATQEDLENYEQAIDDYPLLDTLRRWTAPYDGPVTIIAPVNLVEDPAGEGDGVRVAIQHNDTELWASTIAGNDHAERTPTGLDGIPVAAGDRIYFRVQSIQDGRFDQVSWDPIIEYTASEPMTDVNGLDAYRYWASDEFTLAGSPDISFQTPITGTVELSGDFQKLAQTTDDIRLIITVNGESVLSEMMTWDETGAIPVQVVFPVEGNHDETPGTIIDLKVEVDSPIDLRALAWRPRLSYTEVESESESGDQSLLVFDLPYEIDMYPVTNLSEPQQSWTATQDGALSVATGFANSDPSKGAVVFTVKRAGEPPVDPLVTPQPVGEMLAKVTIKPEGEAATDAELMVDVKQGDILYFDYSTRDPELAATITSAAVQVYYEGGDSEDGDKAANISVPSAIHYPAASSLFPQAYRGWAYAGYNGNRARANQPIIENNLVFNPPQTDEVYNISSASAYPFVPVLGIRPELDVWGGVDNSAYVSASTISSSRLGADSITPPGSGVAGSDTPQLLSRTYQNSLGAGVGPLMASYSGHSEMVGLDALQGLPELGMSYSELDYMDMNGDGFPDVVSKGKIQYTTMRGGLMESANIPLFSGWVRESQSGAANVGIGGNVPNFRAGANGTVGNTGRGSPKSNKSGSQMPTLGLSVGVAESASQVVSDLIDINGDGLPDRIAVNGAVIDNITVDCGTAELCVSLNLGYSFAEMEPWGNGDISWGASHGFNFGPSLGFNTGIYDYAGGFSLERNRSLAACGRVTPLTDFGEYTDPLSRPCDNENLGTSLQDMNGDGLIDRVKVENNSLYVAFNTGSGFAPEVEWAAGIEQVGMSTDTSLGGGAYFTVPILTPIGFLIINPGADYSRSIGRQEIQLRDIDGDGNADYLMSSDDHEITVQRNSTGKTNLLKTVIRPLGAEISLDYQRSGNTTDDPYSHWNLARVEIFDGQPGDGADTQLITYRYDGGRYDRLEREFYGYQQVIAEERDTLNNGAFYRATVREFSNNSYYTKGLLTSEVVQDATGAKFIETVYSYVLRDEKTKPETGDMQSTTASLFPMLTRTDQRYYEGSPYAGKSTYTTMEYDDFGNVKFFFDAGDKGELDNVSAIVEYSDCQGIYVMSVPKSIVVTGGDTTPLRNRDAEVDCETGDVTQVRQYLADGSAVVTDLVYDENGNLQQVTGPDNLHGKGYKLTYEYDPFVQTYVTSVTDSFGYSSTAVYNYKYGTVESSIDLNGNKISYIYDMFGRVSSVTGPNEQGGSTPTIQFEYHPEAVVPWALTKHFDTYRSPSDFIETVLFTDGLKRVIQTKKDGTVYDEASSQPRDVMTVSGRVRFDFAGRATEQYYPVTEPLGAPGVFNPSYDSIQPTRITYDILDRQMLVTLPNNTSTAYGYGFGPDRDGMTQFETTVTDANGMQSQSYQNVQNLVVSLKQFDQGGSQVIWTSYAYNPLKQLTEVMDDQGNTTRVEYDNLGRQTVVDSPDAGRTETIYDLASNVTARITANLRAEGSQITYDYEYGRLKSISYSDNPGNDVTYAYGAPGAPYNRAGRITSVKSQAGTVELFYGRLGEVVKEVNTIATFVPGNMATYTTTFLYDNWGRLQTLGYPDGEVLTYRYDSGGLVRQVSGTKGKFSYDYIRRMEYDKFGQIAFTETGNNVRTQYTYQPENRRLENLQAGKGQGNPFQNLNYTYDNVGNVLSLTNDIPIAPASQFGGPTTQTFQYDDLYRLVGAAGSYQFSPGKTNSYQLSMSYDSINNILTKQQVNGITQPSGTVVEQQKTTHDRAYAYDGSQPHAATHIGDLTFTYDANGNQLGWSNDLNGTQRTIVWDEENRIQSIFDNGQEMTYKYDAAGQRVIKRGPQGETITVNQYYTVRNGKLGTKHIYVGETRMASKLVKDNAREKDQYYYHPDQLGSSNYVTDTNGQVYEHMEYFPSGEAWVQEAGNTQRTPYLFTGKEMDEETGLYYYGARYYDPRTSLWQSPDPALADYLSNPSSGDVYNPANLSLYAYAAQNPLKYVDPDGWRIVIKGGGPDFARQVHMAMNYLKDNSPTARELFKRLENTQDVVTITNVNAANPHAVFVGRGYEHTARRADQTIYWSATEGLNVPGRGTMSPALLLGHEAGHADEFIRLGYQPWVDKTAEFPRGPDYPDHSPEERRNVQSETQIATELMRGGWNETTRDHYRDVNETNLTQASSVVPFRRSAGPTASVKDRIKFFSSSSH